MNVENPLDITAIDDDRHKEAFATLTLAFAGDKTTRWVFDDPAAYLEHFPRLAAVVCGAAFGAGAAYQIDDFAGVSLWLPPGVHPDQEAIESIVTEVVPKNKLDDIFATFEELDTYHPQEPHWYLPMIGVDPIRQNCGLGSKLMAHTLIRCDEEGVPAYLESSNPASVSLYRRHGFEPIGSKIVGGQSLVTPMLRPARTSNRIK